jgi:hypothetical protein
MPGMDMPGSASSPPATPSTGTGSGAGVDSGKSDPPTSGAPADSSGITGLLSGLTGGSGLGEGGLGALLDGIGSEFLLFPL